MPLEASVVIPTYNRSLILSRCLQALANQTLPSEHYELIVVDDGSTDDTPQVVGSFIQSHSSVRVQYLRSDTRLGITKTRNRGIRAAQGRVMIQTDSDFVAVPEFIEAHLEIHKEPRCICTGPAINVYRLEDIFVKKPTVEDICRHSFPGFNSSVERDFIVEAGLYDENLNEYGWEDAEMSVRLRKLGAKPRRSERAVGYHYHRRFQVNDLPSIRAREAERARMALVFVDRWPEFSVRMKTWVSPVFFALDRLIFPCNWIHSKAVERAMERWIASGNIRWAEAMKQLYANHAYIQGLRQAIEERRQRRPS